MKVLIVGAGIVGLSTAWALARRGHEPLVFDQGPIPNPLAASTDKHRMIRHAYGAAAGYGHMVDQAFSAWKDLWDDLGVRHYRQSGTVALSTAPGDWADQSRETQAHLGQPHRVLDGPELASLLPQIAVPTGAWGLYNRAGGPLLANRILDDLIAHLTATGVALFPERRVTAIDPAAGRITLVDGRVERGEHVVIASGAWIGKLLPAYAARTAPRRSVVVYVAPPTQHAETWRDGPALVQYTEPGTLYTLPPVDDIALKFGGPPFTPRGDPDAPRTAADGEGASIVGHFAPILKDAEDYRVLEPVVCYYTDGADERFIVEARERMLVVTNCAGHMFKFGPLMGQQIARCLAGDLDPGGLTRWAAGELPTV